MATGSWNIDKAHSSVAFSVRHMVIARVNGTFTEWDGTLRLDPDNLGDSAVEVRINSASVDTREPDRDAHLRSADFFDVENYPEISFRSTSVQPTAGSKLRITGQLTIHGVTRPVVLDAEFGGRLTDPWGLDRVGFTAATHIDRKDFDLTWNAALDNGGIVVGDTVEITIELEATAATAAGSVAAA